ncbi:MAG: hypothetical protein ABSG68_10025 [Thermoguttaceae bacterium]
MIIEIAIVLNLSQVTFQVIRNLLEHPRKKRGDVMECWRFLEWATMVVSKMPEHRSPLVVGQFLKHVTVSVVVKVGQVNEAATEAVDRLDPPVKPIGKLDHLAIGEALSHSLDSPLPAVDGCVDEILTVLTVSLRQEKDDPDERVQFLTEY